MDGMASVLARLKAMNGTGRQMDVHQAEMIAAGDCLNKLEENEGFGKNTISSNVTYVCYAPLSKLKFVFSHETNFIQYFNNPEWFIMRPRLYLQPKCLYLRRGERHASHRR